MTDLDIDFGFNHGLQGSSNRENASVGRSSLLVVYKWGKLLENPLDQLNFSWLQFG